jgi:hypothetical protein
MLLGQPNQAIGRHSGENHGWHICQHAGFEARLHSARKNRASMSLDLNPRATPNPTPGQPRGATRRRWLSVNYRLLRRRKSVFSCHPLYRIRLSPLPQTPAR